LKLALTFFNSDRPALIINHGLSGSGKTVFSQSALETLGAVCVRSDVERKRLHHLPANARTGSGVESDLYSRGRDTRHVSASGGTGAIHCDGRFSGDCGRYFHCALAA